MMNDTLLNIQLSLNNIKISQDIILYISFYTNKFRIMLTIRIWKTNISGNCNTQFNLNVRNVNSNGDKTNIKLPFLIIYFHYWNICCYSNSAVVALTYSCIYYCT